MYTSADLTNTNIITGYLDQSGEFVYPTARQKFDISGTGITVNPFLFDRLLAEPVTVTRVAYPGPDLTVGNFGSAEITFTIWNRSGERNQIYGDFMASVYIESDHEAFAAPEGATCYAETDDNSIIYGTENGAYIDGTLIDISDGDHIIFISCQGGVHETLIYGENATYSRRSDFVWEAWEPLGEEQLRFFTMQQQEYQSSLTHHWVDIHNDGGNSRPAYTWNVNTGIKTKWAKIPLGVFTITNCDYQDEAIAITAMDGVAFDRDATEFLNGLDYSQGLTIMDIGDAIANKCVIGQFGADWGGNSSSTIYTSNPFAGLTLTYREAVKYIAAYFCANAAINRFGHLRFFNQAFYDTECSYTDDGGVTTIGPVRVTPDRIVRGTRSAASFEVPTITRVDFVQSDGSVVTYGSVPSSSSGTSKIYVFPYNPLLDKSRAPDLRYNVILAWFSLMPQYRPAQMSVVYADPRIDCGDRVTFPLDASGETTFSTPISMISLRWVNGCVADYSADGQREREKYTDDADYTTQVLDNLGNGNLDLVRVTDGEDEVGITPAGIVWNHAVGGQSNLQMYTLYHSSSSTAEKSYTMDVPSGIYLFLHSRQSTPISAAQGAQLVTIGTVSGTTALITLLIGGADLTATSGTRSQVSISNTAGGTATVTWTVQGRSYRRLVMVRLM